MPNDPKSGAPESASPKGDYKSTVFLPKTGFAMKAGLPEREPQIGRAHV